MLEIHIKSAKLLGMEELRLIIGKNLTELRKRKGLTQLELAEKFNYTDRAISKWENGDTVPDIVVLYNLCEFYGVTLDYLTHEDNDQYIKKDLDEGLENWNKIAISALVTSIVWMIATIIFVYTLFNEKTKANPLWQSFVWAVPASMIVLLFFEKHYFRRKIVYFIYWSIFLWGTIASIYVSTLSFNAWPLFIVGIPAQITLIIWLNIKKIPKKNKEE